MTLALSAPIRQKASPDARVLTAALVVLGLFLALFIVLPLLTVFERSLYDRADAFIGLANFIAFFETPELSHSVVNSLTIALVSTALTTGLAFTYAFALTRSAMPAKGLFKALAQIPILAPSLLPGISLVYLFGNQGPLRGLLLGESIYGPIGIVLGEVFYTFPHAVMILVVALSTADARLYEAAESLGAGPLRRFLEHKLALNRGKADTLRIHGAQVFAFASVYAFAFAVNKYGGDNPPMTLPVFCVAESGSNAPDFLYDRQVRVS